MAVKKWITKTEINALLKNYSVRTDEFREVSEYTFLNDFIKGYMLTIHEEICGKEKTGRIIVSHTQCNGKKSVIDIWERDKDKKLQFRFRNPYNSPISDIGYIEQLENENKELRLLGRTAMAKSSDEIEQLQKRIEELENEINTLKQHNAELKPKHNARNAGRRKADGKWTESFSKFTELYESQKSICEIMKEMEISRSTYFRYKKFYEKQCQ